MKPVVDGLAKKYAGTYDIRVMNSWGGDPEVDALANEFGVQYVPTFVFVNTDGSVSGQIVGAVPVSQLEGELAKLK
jgi:thioredoxin-like negative regulator of GroEL